MTSDHSSVGGGGASCRCQKPQAGSTDAAEPAQELDEEPGSWTLRITDPRQKLRKVIVHYRLVTPAGLAGWIAFNPVPDSRMWALVVVIAILTLGNIFIARRSE